MTVNPVPRITITPTAYPAVTFTPQVAAAPSNSGHLLYALDDVTVQWGRERFTDHAEPATAQFGLLQLDNGFVPDWMDAGVTASWSDPASGASLVFFRGRITDQKLRPRAGAGCFVDLTAISWESALSNVLTGTASWPEETALARLQRLYALQGSWVADMAYPADWQQAPVSARNVQANSVRDLLASLYDTAGAARMIYDPGRNWVTFVTRKLLPVDSSGYSPAARLRNDPAMYSGGVHLSASSTTTWPMLDAEYLEGPGELDRDISSRVTRVNFHWTESNGTVPKTLPLTNYRDESKVGVVMADVQTELRDATWAQRCAQEWLDMLTIEGYRYVPAQLVYRADRAGGFDTLAQAAALISGMETYDGTHPGVAGNSNMLTIAGGRWSRMYFPPVITVIGGTIRYVGGQWRPAINTQLPSWSGAPHPYVALRDLLANPSRDPFTLRQLAHSIKWNDLYNVYKW